VLFSVALFYLAAAGARCDVVLSRLAALAHSSVLLKASGIALRQGLGVVSVVRDVCRDAQLLQHAAVSNAVVRVGFQEAALRRDTVIRVDHVFSKKLPIEGKATSQASSGRCWLFAAANVMRLAMMEKYSLPTDFELSQNYL
jgi:hypothetical protein